MCTIDYVTIIETCYTRETMFIVVHNIYVVYMIEE
jgi:hypothetical protein